MKNCKCKWEGALDGTIRRCRDHQNLLNLERKMRQEFEQNLKETLREQGTALTRSK